MEREKCKKCGSENIVMVEYAWDSPEHYDGTSEIDCKDCGARFGRWSGKELIGEEIEKRYGKEKQNKPARHANGVLRARHN